MERLYIAQGERGLFKVGKTSNFDRRLCTLRGQFKRRNDLLARHHAFPEIHVVYGAEMTFIDRLAAKHTRRGGREWFEGVDFDAAIAIGVELTAKYEGSRPINAETLARWAIENEARAAQRAAWKARHLEVRAKLEIERSRRRLIRAHGLRSFDGIVAAVTRPDVAWDVLRLQTAPTEQGA